MNIRNIQAYLNTIRVCCDNAEDAIRHGDSITCGKLLDEIVNATELCKLENTLQKLISIDDGYETYP